ncbi:type II toxin-antitoxin system RelE family toxin [Candidatus Mycalebacterium sp.]
MPRYTVKPLPSAEDDIRSLPTKRDQRLVIGRIGRLASDPFPMGKHRKVLGEEDLYRVRQGDYRIFYAVDETNKKVTISAVKHRKEAYR